MKLIMTAALVVAPGSLLANGMRLLSQDGFATARGEAFVATADNASAIYYNPAGLTQLEGTQLRAGLYGVFLDPTFRPPESAPNSGNTYHIEDKLAAVPQFFATHTLENAPLSLGLGVYAPFGLSATWPQDTGFRAVATEGTLTYVTINPVLALKLAPGLSIAGGVTVNYAKLDLEQGLVKYYQAGFPDSFRFVGDGWSVGYNLGLLWQPHEKVALGASFRSAATVTLDGRTEIERYPVIAPTRLPAEADFKFPLTAVVGLSYRPTPHWNLEFDADYTDWSSFGTVTIQQHGVPPFVVQQDILLTLRWEPSWAYKVGATRYFDNGWHISAGYVFNENSIPDANYTPLVADLDRHFFAVGTGFKGRRFDFDVAYQFGYGPARTVTGSNPSTAGQIAGQSADGKYDFISHAVLVTVGMHF
jgi:long-chain fatty acid transport protein